MLTYKQKKELKQLEQQKENFILFVQEMNYNKKFSPENFIRKLRPYFRMVRSKHFIYLRFRNTDLTMCIEPLPILHGNKKLFEVRSNSHRKYVYTLSANSHKELLLKIIKHNLLWFTS